MQFSEHVKIRKEKFGTVIFDTLTEKIFITNETGGEILRLIGEGNDLQQVVFRLKDSYAIDEDSIEGEVSDFIAHLKVNKFIKDEDKIS